MIGLSVAVVIGVVIVRRLVMGGVTGTTSLAVPGLAELSGPQRVWVVLSTGATVAKLLLWPTSQMPDYGPSSLLTGYDRNVAATAVLVLTILGIAWAAQLALRSNRPDSRPLAGILWCLIAYFPASNLLAATGAIVAERTLYTASVGVAILISWCLERALEHAAERRVSLRGGAIIPTLAGAIVLAASFRGFVQTKDYARVWRKHETVFSRMVEADPLNYRGYQLLALAMKDNKRYAESARLYALAYARRPSDVTLLADYGEYLLQMHRPRYAVAIGERLMTHRDAWTDSRAVSLLLNATGQSWGPDSVLAAAQRLNARAPSARSALFIGMVDELKGDSAAAQAAYRAGLRIAPRDSALRTHARMDP
jgi:tetratricopeptide (TPR) repeat protein